MVESGAAYQLVEDRHAREEDEEKYHSRDELSDGSSGNRNEQGSGWLDYVSAYVSWFYAMLPSWQSFSNLIFASFGQRETPFELTPAMQDRVDRFKVFIAVAWDEREQQHAAMLQEYWALCFPGVPFERKTKKWTDIGFQGPDPGTDFRGAGAFGLSHLCYFARNKPREFAAARESGYPVSIAGLNLTMMLYQVLGWGFKKVVVSSDKKKALFEFLFGRDDRGTRFEHLYCCAFRVLDDEWRRQNATYMQFPIVLQKTQELFISQIPQFVASFQEQAEEDPEPLIKGLKRN